MEVNTIHCESYAFVEVNTVHCESYAFAEVDAQLLHERKFTSLATKNVVHVWAKFLQNIHIPVCNRCKEVALFLFNFHHNCTTFLPTREASEAKSFSSLLSVHIVPPTSVPCWALALIFMMMNLPANHNFPRVATCFSDHTVLYCLWTLLVYMHINRVKCIHRLCKISILSRDWTAHSIQGLHGSTQYSKGQVEERERTSVSGVTQKLTLWYWAQDNKAGLPPLSLSKIPPMCPGIRLCMVQGV